MTNIIFLFGTIAGLIIIGCMIAVFIASGDNHDFSYVAVLRGYLIMVVALSMIFFAVKRYRDQELGGVIKFLPAFLMGIAISLVASVIYVLVWEVYLAATNFSFVDLMGKAMVEAARAEGATGATLDAVIKEAEDFKILYMNPLARAAFTFIEIFPVGFAISLISALILRNPRALPANA